MRPTLTPIEGPIATIYYKFSFTYHIPLFLLFDFRLADFILDKKYKYSITICCINMNFYEDTLDLFFQLNKKNQ